MYKTFVRPILFLLGPETAHSFIASILRLIIKIPGISPLFTSLFRAGVSNSPITIGNLVFNGRVGLAAGFDKNAEYVDAMSIFGFSFIEIGTVTPVGQYGNNKPRLFRVIGDKAMINRMGFNNKGVDHAVHQLKKRNSNVLVGGNIGKNTLTRNEDAPGDYAVCFEKLYHAVDYFTINVSCPNIKGMEKLQDYQSIWQIVHEVMNIRKTKPEEKPVFLKISPDLSFSQIDDMLELYDKTGLNGIVATNTSTSRQGISLAESRIHSIGNGGLSGRPLKNRAVEVVDYICKQSDYTIPVIASGGIFSPADALDMVQAGASLVQVYTGFIYEGPFMVKRINRALEKYFSADGV